MNNTEENDELLFDEILKTEQNFFDDEISEEDLFDERVFEDDNPIVEPKKDKLTKEEKLKIIEERKKERAEKIQALKEQKLLELKEQKRKEKEAKLEKLKQQKEIAEKKQIEDQNRQEKNVDKSISENSKNIEKDKMEKKQKDRIKKLRSQLNKDDIKNMDKPYEDEENFDDIFEDEAELIDIFDVSDDDKNENIENETSENNKVEEKNNNPIINGNSKKEKVKKNKKEKNAKKENADKKEKKERNIFVKLISAITKTIWYLFLVLVIILAIRAVAYKKTDVMGYRVHLVLSGSMEPTIDAGDLVISKPVKKDEIKEGDVIAFKEDNMDVIHRVKKVYTNHDGKKLFKTQGDNNNTEDRGLLDEDSVMGTFAFRVKNMAKLVLWMQNNIVVVLVALIGVTIMFIIIRRLINGK